MLEGRAEIFSMQSRMVFAAIHPNILFGDLAFFLSGTKQIASARAHQSCQVLQLDRRAWKNLWPDSDRLSLERQLIPVMAKKYRTTFTAYVSIMKNLKLAKEKCLAVSQGSTSKRRRRTSMLLAGSKLARVLISDATHRDRYDSYRVSWMSSLSRIGSALKNRFLGDLSSKISSPSIELISHEQEKSHTDSRGAITHTSCVDIFTAESEQEKMWRRHAKNLRLLKFLGERMVEAEKTLNPLHHGQRDPIAQPMSAKFPHLVKPKVRNAGFGSANLLVERSPECSSSESLMPRRNRHSIQTNPAEMAIKLTALDASTAATLFSKESDTRATTTTTNAPVDAGPQLLERKHISLKRGKSTAHLSSAPLRRARSKSIHGTQAHLDKITDSNRKQNSIDISKKKYPVAATRPRRPYDIWFEPPPPPAFFMPNSTFRGIWEFVMLQVCIYYVVIIPFRICFVHFHVNQVHDDALPMWLAIEYIMDFLCILDFILQKNYFVFVHRGELVADPNLIRNHYLQEGSYLADLVCILPLELLALAISWLKHGVGTETWFHVFWGYRINKMIRVIHLHSHGEQIQRMLIYDMKLTAIRPSIIYFLRFAFQFALGAHWVACLFYGGAYYVFHDGGHSNDSWLKMPGMLSFSGCNDLSEISQIPLLARYTRAYYFSIGSITTVSYGDIAPANAWETFVACIVIVQSAVYFGMLAGGFFQMFEMELGKRADYEERVAHIGHYMLFHRFPARTWKQMQVYFAVHWQESRGLNEEDSLRGLTLSVKQDIAHFVKHDFVIQLQLFKTCEEAFSRAVVAAFQQELFVRNDILISVGDTGRSLFVIESGLVSVRISKRIPQKAETVDFEVIKGRYEFIGEKSLIFGIPRTATCIAMCACSVLILTIESYEQILEEFPDYRDKNMREWIFTRGMAKPLNVDTTH